MLSNALLGISLIHVMHVICDGIEHVYFGYEIGMRNVLNMNCLNWIGVLTVLTYFFQLISLFGILLQIALPFTFIDSCI